jgi:hypothetical protein
VASRSSHPELSQNDVAQLARCHQLCLPETASSRAGLDVLQGLYNSLLADSAALVVWYPAPSEPHHLGAFAAGTKRVRDTEAKIRQSLPKALFVRLALRVASMPRHVLARRRWESVIPQVGIGYVLTLGVARSVTPAAITPSGKSILAELEAWFVGQHCDESWVDTELSNQRAHAFYLRVGYVEVARDFGQVLLKKTLR